MTAQNDSRALVFAPIGRDAELTAGALQKAGISAEPCSTVQDLCDCITQGAGIAIVAEEALTIHSVECLTKVLEEQPPWSDLPFVILTGGGRSTEVSLSHIPLMERLGHITLLERPVRIVTLVAAVRTGLRSRTRQYELRDRIEALRASEARFRGAFANAAVGMVVTDLEGHCLEVNSSLCVMLGYTQEELLQKSLVDMTHPAHIAEGRRLFGLLISGTIPAFTHEMEYICRTGESIWARISASLVRDEEGKPVNMIALVEEITYRRQAEEMLAQQAAELARSNADLQQFAWVSSHDLREPLRTIIAFSQLLASRYAGKLDSEADNALEFIQASGKRMDVLIRDLLTFSRVVNTEEKPTSRIALANALDWAMANLQASLTESGAEVTRGRLCEVMADEVQVVQLLQNLLSNAIKYRGYEPPRIHVSSEVEGEYCTVRVKDNGVGIDHRYHERIFGLFKRLHGNEIQGTGLGLAICRKIVERHGGRIWVESTPGQGSTFCFTLPAAIERQPSRGC